MPEETIKVRKKNEVFLTVECEPSTAYELSEFFTFFVPGHKFMPAFKNKLWDGKIRLFDQRTKTIYGGLLQYIHEFAETRKYGLEYVFDEYYGLPDAQELLELEQIQQFTESLNLFAHGKAIVPRDYQLEAIHHALTHYRALLLSPTASGKSLIIYVLLRWFLQSNDSKVLLIVPTTSLVEQMYTDFKDYSTLDESWDNEATCHRIYSGKEKHNVSSRVVITTWQSIYKMDATWFKPFGMVIGDEAHTFKAKSLCKILENLRDAKYRIGTTGTLDGTQCFDRNTQITTRDGTKKITEINPGDAVLTMNEKTFQIEYKPVRRLFNNGRTQKMLKIRTGLGEMIVTPDHQIMTLGGWKKAKDLTTLDKIVSIS